MQPAATSSSSASSAGAGPASPPTLHAPTGDSLLINLVSTADPAQKKLFKQCEIYSLNVKKGGGLLGTGLMMETMPYDEIKVTSKSTLNDLKKTFIRGFAINTQAHVKRFPDPGVELVPAGVDPKNPNGVKIVVTGNAGRDNRLKLAEGGFVDTNDLPVFGLLDVTKGEVEQLFKRMDLVAAALAAAGVLILFTGIFTAFKNPTRKGITTADGVWLGAIQGISLPFRGFSRSGVTISLGLLRGIDRKRAEEFSFAMAVALTPAALGYEAYKLYEKLKQTSPVGMGLHDLKPGLEGLLFSFGAGLIALKLLSKLLEKGQWWIFGVYCLAASAGVYYLHLYPHALDHSLHFLHPES
jgi:undecaprenyl pyrophosphate phosphatase UppP